MNDTMAKLSAITSAVLIAATVVILYVTSHPGAGTTTVKAEFEDAFPILAGMNLRESGAVAGSVRTVELTDHGTAMVTLSLNEGTEPPRSDASVAIRQQDVTGDSYVSLEPGHAPAPLGDATIPVSRTIVAPRFDDLLNSLGDKERVALRLLLVETGKALEARGDDVNQAVLELRPGLQATREALSEIASQNGSLRTLVGDAERVTGQAAPHSAQLAGLVDSLSVTLGETAAHSQALDRGLAAAPQTATQAQHTLARLRRTAVAAAPLARALGEGAPDLAQSLRRLGPFLGDTRIALRHLQPTLTQTTGVLRQARPTLQAAPKHVVTAPFELAGSVDDLLRALLGNEDVLKTLFGADAYGNPPGNRDDVGLGSIAVEGGNQSGYPGNDPARNFLRAVVIPSCEAFGLKIAPGCLLEAISTGSATRGHRAGDGEAAAPGSAQAPSASDANGSPAQLGPSPASPLVPPPGPATRPGNPLRLLDLLLG
ncbi:MAG: MlaD family protein [Solirubrobacterales bacterium]